MYIFQSEQVIKLQFWLKNNLADISVARSQTPDYHVCVRYLDAIYAKTKQHCQAEIALLSIWNDLPQEFTDKAILSFRKRLRFCVAAAGRHFEHSV